MRPSRAARPVLLTGFLLVLVRFGMLEASADGEFAPLIERLNCIHGDTEF